MKRILLILLLFSMTSCQLWKKVLYGPDPCNPAKGRQMERGHVGPQKNLSY